MFSSCRNVAGKGVTEGAFLLYHKTQITGLNFIMQKIALDSLAFFRGCVTPGCRMSEDLLNFYNDCEARVVRAKSASGVQIAFVTDAVEMEYSVAFGAPARRIYTSDITINGETTTVEGEGPHKFTMAPGEKHIVIQLPHLVVIEEISLAVNEGAVVKEAPRRAKKLLFCGDSILQGMTCTAPGKAVGALLSEKLGMELHNTSVGGAEMRFEAVEATLALGGDVIVVGFGINDTFHQVPYELFRERTARVLQLLAGFSGKAFIVVPIPNMKVDNALYESYCNIIREEHKKNPAAVLIEGASFYPARDELFVDATHPNDEGMKIYADGLEKIIAPALS